jgi:hypothetical protein
MGAGDSYCGILEIQNLLSSILHGKWISFRVAGKTFLSGCRDEMNLKDKAGPIAPQ